MVAVVVVVVPETMGWEVAVVMVLVGLEVLVVALVVPAPMVAVEVSPAACPQPVIITVSMHNSNGKMISLLLIRFIILLADTGGTP